MCIENPTLAHFRHFSPLFTNLPSTSVENTLQIISFMQNKPNSPNVQLNLTSFVAMNYAIFISLTKVKNKPNSNPIKAKTNPIQTQLKSKQSQFEPKQTQVPATEELVPGVCSLAFLSGAKPTHHRLEIRTTVV